MMKDKQEFVKKVLQLEEIPQSPKWHPEGNTLEHVKFIIYGLHLKKDFGFISYKEYEFLTWVALFHDLGKIDTLTFDDDGNPHAYGHEYKAERYIDGYQNIIDDDIDIDKLKKFCLKHMKAHLQAGNKMRMSKKKEFRKSFSQKDFYLLMTFESCDSSHNLYEFLRRTPIHFEQVHLSPIEFYNERRHVMEQFFGYNFEAWLKNKIK